MKKKIIFTGEKNIVYISICVFRILLYFTLFKKKFIILEKITKWINISLYVKIDLRN